MKILTPDNKCFEMNSLPDEIDDIRYCVMDVTDKDDPDFFFIPLVLILPRYYGEFGIWISFPIAEVVATIVTAYFLRKELKRYNK